MRSRKMFAVKSYHDGSWNGIAFVIFFLFFLLTGHLDNLLVFVVSFFFGMFAVITIFNYNTGYGFLAFMTLVKKSNIIDRVELTLDRVGIPQPTTSGGRYMNILKEKYGSNVDEISFDIREVEDSQ